MKEARFKLEVLPAATKKAFQYLSKQAWLGKSKWYLAGGTALALQVGHRRSLDLDFFIPDKTFDADALLRNLASNDWHTDVNEPGTIYGKLAGAKISFIAYPFFAPAQPMLSSGHLHMLDKKDIAVMKIVALSQRGRKRDFFDLYWYANNVEPLEKIFARLPKQYPDIGKEFHHAIKSLDYFADADDDPAPQIFFAASWQEVKRFFKSEAVRLTKTRFDLE